MKITLAILLLTSLLYAASFEVASVKPSNAPPGSSGMDTDDALLRAYNVTLKRCIIGAYGIPGPQIIGGPKWLDDLRYDITARAGHKAGDGELMMMLQSLLADRFKLAVHHESQIISGYALTVAKGGIKAKVSESTGNSSTQGGRNQIVAVGCPMSRLIIRLSAILGVPIVDQTEEKRSFDFTLKWVPEEVQMKAGSSDVSDGPSLFTALQEQLGLKLESRKVPVDVLVIDHAEPPTEN